jgi:hypothetical protein
MRLRGIICLAAVMLASLVTSCSHNSHTMQNCTRINGAAPGKALVTFIRATGYGGGINFAVWDGESCIGMVNAKKYVQHQCDPGEHVFTAQGRGWGFIKADLEEGKRYFVLVNVYPGMWSPKVSFQPIAKRKAEPEKIERWLTELQPRSVKPELMENWARPRRRHITARIAKVKAGQLKSFELKREDGF